MRSALLLLLLPLASCCPPATTETIVVQAGAIRLNPDGSYTVSDGWLLERMHYERGLLTALEKCEKSK